MSDNSFTVLIVSSLSKQFLRVPVPDKITVYYYVPSGSRDFSNFAEEYLSMRNTREKIIMGKNSLFSHASFINLEMLAEDFSSTQIAYATNCLSKTLLVYTTVRSNSNYNLLSVKIPATIEKIRKIKALKAYEKRINKERQVTP